MTNNKEIRTQLKVIGNTERHRFTGTFSRYGFKWHLTNHMPSQPLCWKAFVMKLENWLPTISG